MPRVAIPIQEIARNNGAEAVDVNADQANGHYFDNDGNTLIVAHNGDGVSRDVTFVSKACSHGRTGDKVISVAAGKRMVFPALDPDLWNQSGADAGRVFVNLSAGTTSAVKLHAIRRTP